MQLKKNLESDDLDKMYVPLRRKGDDLFTHFFFNLSLPLFFYLHNLFTRPIVSNEKKINYRIMIMFN
ncbi:hypothetical protein D0A34_13110 [Microcoleus vaginatus PCC 9802]|nr:hypothetical protein MicvaDRAFT_4333 [Microcoleus vaginatus FGP-2]UNU19685.1 hypothetical protein D0A34_13110 [Microcoleus vaginatus PCC 9802]